MLFTKERGWNVTAFNKLQKVASDDGFLNCSFLNNNSTMPVHF